MVPLLKNQALADQPTLRVYSDDGEYADTDLILCADETNPDVPSAMLQAQFVKYGAIVYRFNTPEELGEAIFALDPDSALDAVALYKEQVARDAARNAGTLAPSDPVPAPDSPDPAADVPADTPADIPNSQEPDTQFFQEQAAQDAASSTPQTNATSTPELPVIEAGDPEVLGTTTQDIIPEAPPAATSTPDTNPVTVGDIASTTPDVVPPDSLPVIDISTTTP